MSPEKDLQDLLSNFFDSSNVDDFGAQLTDNSQLTPQQKSDLAYEVLRQNLDDSSCFICGTPFTNETMPSAVYLGPIGENDTIATAHDTCSCKVIDQNPELKPLLGRHWSDYSAEEQALFRRTFSQVLPGSDYDTLFRPLPPKLSSE